MAHALICNNEHGMDAQNVSQMYNFLYASLAHEAKFMVLSDLADYSMLTADETQVYSGPCVLKVVIIRHAKVDTHSTVFHLLWKNLNQLDAKNSRNQLRHQSVQSLYHQSGRATDRPGGDIVRPTHQLVCRLHRRSHKEFVEYVKKQKDKFEGRQRCHNKEIDAGITHQVQRPPAVRQMASSICQPQQGQSHH